MLSETEIDDSDQVGIHLNDELASRPDNKTTTQITFPFQNYLLIMVPVFFWKLAMSISRWFLSNKNVSGKIEDIIFNLANHLAVKYTGFEQGTS